METPFPVSRYRRARRRAAFAGCAGRRRQSGRRRRASRCPCSSPAPARRSCRPASFPTGRACAPPAPTTRPW
ncbi:hypothetical protein [Azospirillum canadense]|uniref:hypothetical protein n=1 Tax=Azospirillum canadense TaxID=403962 RepID=UPI0038733B4E